jgi:hypothetical protein
MQKYCTQRWPRASSALTYQRDGKRTKIYGPCILNADIIHRTRFAQKMDWIEANWPLSGLTVVPALAFPAGKLKCMGVTVADDAGGPFALALIGQFGQDCS